MDSDLVLRNQIGISSQESLQGLSEDEIIGLVKRFAIWPSTDSYLIAPWIARFALRRQRHRIDDRAPGEKRDLWGMPDEAGFFADDNSLLKSTFKNLSISGRDNPYGNRTITRGLVCCHIWPATTGNPVLFSFIPNLVWLPKSLSRFTDVFADRPVHKVHYVLQELSYRRYRDLQVLTGFEDSKKAWKLLERPDIGLAEDLPLNEMNTEPRLSRLVHQRHTRLKSFLDSAIEESPSVHGRFSKRYHLGHGSGIDKTVPPITDLVSAEKLTELRKIVIETFPIIF